MREIDNDKNNLADRLMSNLELDVPSDSFTSDIMQQLQAERVSTVFSYQPLIKARSFVFIGIIAILFFASIFLFQPLRHSSWLDIVSFKGIELNYVNLTMPAFSSSRMMIYASVLFLIMLLVQINSIKNFHRKSIGF